MFQRSSGHVPFLRLQRRFVWVQLLCLACISLMITHARATAASTADAGPIASAVLSMPVPQPPFFLAVCTMFYNEKRYLLEWVAYHYMLGFEHFYMYDNDSTDEPLTVLQPLIDRGIVTHIPWPGQAPQGKQLSHCFNASAPRQTKWMAGFDIDEFVVVQSETPVEALFTKQRTFYLHRFLQHMQSWHIGAVTLDRMEFGSSGHEQPVDGLVMREFTTRALAVRPAHVVGKVLVLMDALGRMRTAHTVEVLETWKRVTADVEVIPEHDSKVLHNRFEPVRINHYITRSYGECVAKLTAARWHTSVDWRSRAGRAMCDKRMKGKQGYREDENAVEYQLAASLFPDVVERVVAELMKIKEV